MSCNLSGRRADRRAYGHFALAREQANEQQVADVRAADQQEKQRRDAENARRRVELPEQLISQGARNQAVAFKCLGIGRFVAFGDCSQVRSGRGYASAGLQVPDAPKDRADAVGGPRVSGKCVGQAERNPGVARLGIALFIESIGKAARQNAGYGERPSTQLNGFADDVWIRRELAMPEAVTENNDSLSSVSAVFVFAKHATESRMDTQEREIGRRAIGDSDASGFAVARQRQRTRKLICGEAIESRAVLENVAVSGIAELRAALGVAGIGLRNIDETIRIGIRQRAQENAANDAKDDSVRSDADGQRHEYNGRKSRRLQEKSRRLMNLCR